MEIYNHKTIIINKQFHYFSAAYGHFIIVISE